MLNKVIVIGCPGSGKSTFSRKLNEVTGLPLYHLDMIYHRPDRTHILRKEFDSCMAEILSRDRWIIDGNYQRTLETRIKACDTVFLFDLPAEVCLAGAWERVGKARPDLPWVEKEFDTEFKRFIMEFPMNDLPRIYSLFERYADKNTVIFKSREQADNYLLTYNKE